VRVDLAGQVERTVGGVEVLLAPAPVSEAAHGYFAKDRGQGPLMAGFCRAVHDAFSTGDVAETLFALGPQLDVVLEEPADDLAHVGGETVFQLGVGHGICVLRAQPGDDALEGLA
jgi:hypothetical protein